MLHMLWTLHAVAHNMYVRHLRQNTKMQLSKKACWEEEGLDGLGSFEHEGGLRAKHLP